MPSPAHFAAMATLLDSMRSDVRLLMGLLRIPQGLRLEVLTGRQRYWKESIPHYVNYHPGDTFTCTAGEGHQWETLEPFRNRVSFSPALFPRP